MTLRLGSGQAPGRGQPERLGTQGHTAYTCAGNNPASLTDSSGHATTPVASHGCDAPEMVPRVPLTTSRRYSTFVRKRIPLAWWRTWAGTESAPVASPVTMIPRSALPPPSYPTAPADLGEQGRVALGARGRPPRPPCRPSPPQVPRPSLLPQRWGRGRGFSPGQFG
jgi:hypothetical protein